MLKRALSSRGRLTSNLIQRLFAGTQTTNLGLPEHQVLNLPALSPTMKTGKVGKWNFKEGDSVDVGDVVADIETDKSSVGYELQEEGYIARILIREGEQAQIGAPMFIIVENEADVAAFKDYVVGDNQGNVEAEAVEEVQEEEIEEEVDHSSLPAHSVLTMPSLSPTMKEGKIAQWNFKEGDEVTPGDVLADIETDKSTVGYEIQEDGYVAKILTPGTGVNVPLGQAIAIIVMDKEDVAAFANYSPNAPKKEKTSKPKKSAPASVEDKVQTPQAPTNTNRAPGDRIFISPRAKVYLTEKGIDIAGLKIQGTGPRGRVIYKDAVKYAATPIPLKTETAKPQEKSAPAPAKETAIKPAGYIEIPISGIRRVIAERLTASKQSAPHYYETIAIRMDSLLKYIYALIQAEKRDQ